MSLWLALPQRTKHKKRRVWKRRATRFRRIPSKKVQRLPSPAQSPKTIVTLFEKRNGSLSPLGLPQQIQSSPRSEHNHEDSEGSAENKSPFTVDSAIQLGDEHVSTQPGKKVQCVLFPAQSQKTASFIHYQIEDFGDDDFPESCGSNTFKYTTASHRDVQYGGSRSLKAVGNETSIVPDRQTRRSGSSWAQYLRHVRHVSQIFLQLRPFVALVYMGYIVPSFGTN